MRWIPRTTFARGLWENILGNSREGFEAYEQLAIHFEHRAREPHRAAELARKALVELRNAHRLGTIAPAAYRQHREQFEKRLVRLERKFARSLPDGVESESRAGAGESNQNQAEGGKFNARIG